MSNTPQSSAAYQALYRATIEDAAAGGSALMGRLVATASKDYYARELAARSMHERDALVVAGKLLQRKDAELRALYPKALLSAFNNPGAAKKAATLTLADVQFDQLELMDVGQVQESVSMARAQQVALLAADASLADLNTLICSTLGLKTVRPESNPLRPEAYVLALKQTIEQVDVPVVARLEWMASMSVALGQELHSLYRTMSEKLTGQGVVGVGYAMTQAPLRAGVGVTGSVARDALAWSPPPPTVQRQAPERTSHAGVAVRASEDDDALLTLDRLRQLLAGELEAQTPVNRVKSFAQRFAREFERGDSQRDSELQPAVSDFDATVPAAFEALEEMKQVGQVVKRLEQRKGGIPVLADHGDESVEAIRDVLRRTATGVAQALSLEVVTLMVDNMARNPRLLAPIQHLIAGMEPALMLLSLGDPRFFTDKQHPARELLQEITQRSMAYESTEAPGFGGFLKNLQQAVEPLSSIAIENAEPFERVLAGLREGWRLAALQKEHDREAAVKALQHAEQRNVLAENIARKIEAHPDSAQVPDVVLDFLCGPWAQVVAQARITGGSGSSAADKYQALISALLWSAHPELNRKNTAKLTKLVPLLLVTLRAGLETIRYPATKTNAFLEALMALHQLAFRAASKSVAAAEMPAPVPRLHFVEDGDPWVAPEEAQSSNFLGFEEAQASQSQETEPGTLTADVAVAATMGSIDALPLGSWIELLNNGQWVRTQLTWASPHGTLFLFTSAIGSSQSMTRRTRDKLLEAGTLRIVLGTPMVDGALNAVAQIALRNSVDTTL